MSLWLRGFSAVSFSFLQIHRALLRANQAGMTWRIPSARASRADGSILDAPRLGIQARVLACRGPTFKDADRNINQDDNARSEMAGKFESNSNSDLESNLDLNSDLASKPSLHSYLNVDNEKAKLGYQSKTRMKTSACSIDLNMTCSV